MSWIPMATVLRVGWTLLHFLWQGAVLAGALALLLWLTKGRSPRLRYGLACLALAAMALAPAATWHELGQPQTASRALLQSSKDAAPDFRSASELP